MTDGDQDGALPDGWTLAPLGECVDVLDNLRRPINSTERANRIGSIPYYGATGQVGWIDDHLFDEELVLLGEDGAPFHDKSKPIAYVIDGPSWVNNHAHVLRARSSITMNYYVKYFLDAFDFSDYVQGSTRDKLNQRSMNAIPLALAPLAEQQRIARRLTDIDACSAATAGHLQAAQILLDRFRSAIVAAACSGRLTEGARNDAVSNSNGAPASWQRATLGDLADSIRGGSSEVPTSSVTEYPVLRSSSVRPRSVDYNDVRYLSSGQSQKPANFIENGDLLVTRLNGNIEYVGNAAVVDGLGNRRLQYPDRLFRLRLKEPAHAQYLQLFFASPQARAQVRAASRSAAGHQRISISDLKGFSIALPPLDEQREIVLRCNAMLATAARMTELVEHTAVTLDRVTNASLAKAFRGELVPTEAALAVEDGRDIESAEQPLARVIKAPAPRAKPRKGIGEAR